MTRRLRDSIHVIPLFVSRRERALTVCQYVSDAAVMCEKGVQERPYKTYRKCLMCNVFCNHSFFLNKRYYTVAPLDVLECEVEGKEEPLHFFLVIK